MGFWNWIFGIDNSNSTSPSASTGSAQNNNGRANMKNNTQASRKRSTRKLRQPQKDAGSTE